METNFKKLTEHLYNFLYNINYRKQFEYDFLDLDDYINIDKLLFTDKNNFINNLSNIKIHKSINNNLYGICNIDNDLYNFIDISLYSKNYSKELYNLICCHHLSSITNPNILHNIFSFKIDGKDLKNTIKNDNIKENLEYIVSLKEAYEKIIYLTDFIKNINEEEIYNLLLQLLLTFLNNKISFPDFQLNEITADDILLYELPKEITLYYKFINKTVYIHTKYIFKIFRFNNIDIDYKFITENDNEHFKVSYDLISFINLLYDMYNKTENILFKNILKDVFNFNFKNDDNLNIEKINQLYIKNNKILSINDIINIILKNHKFKNILYINRLMDSDINYMYNSDFEKLLSDVNNSINNYDTLTGGDSDLDDNDGIYNGLNLTETSINGGSFKQNKTETETEINNLNRQNNEDLFLESDSDSSDNPNNNRFNGGYNNIISDNETNSEEESDSDSESDSENEEYDKKQKQKKKINNEEDTEIDSEEDTETNESETDNETDSDNESETDNETDSDNESDSDEDTDTNTDSDEDTDTDSEEDNETDSDSDNEEDTDTNESESDGGKIFKGGLNFDNIYEPNEKDRKEIKAKLNKLDIEHLDRDIYDDIPLNRTELFVKKHKDTKAALFFNNNSSNTSNQSNTTTLNKDMKVADLFKQQNTSQTPQIPQNSQNNLASIFGEPNQIPSQIPNQIPSQIPQQKPTQFMNEERTKIIDSITQDLLNDKIPTADNINPSLLNNISVSQIQNSQNPLIPSQIPINNLPNVSYNPQIPNIPTMPPNISSIPPTMPNVSSIPNVMPNIMPPNIPKVSSVYTTDHPSIIKRGEPTDSLNDLQNFINNSNFQ